MSRTRSELENVGEKIRSFGGEVLILALDIRNVNEIYQAVDKTIKCFSKIDILVNSAGVMILNNAIDFSEEDWAKVIETNLKGSFFMCQAVAKKAMIPQISGKIINITSQLAFVGNHLRSVYCASKGGLLQITRALAIEWADYNIHVNSVAPGYTRTEMTSIILDDEEKYNQVISLIPLRRVAEPKDTSAAVLYLASDCSNFVTGQTIIIDGGYTAR
jgi:2-deoxy-D-gluconate 3-dehydrogenase